MKRFILKGMIYFLPKTSTALVFVKYLNLLSGR